MQPRLDVVGDKDGHDVMRGDGKSVMMSTVDDGTRLVVSTGFESNKTKNADLSTHTISMRCTCDNNKLMNFQVCW